MAAYLSMEEAGQAFRATRDLDIVLIIEALDPSFVARFWEFIRTGGYQIKQRNNERPIFYRFMAPTDTSFPVQIELFSRSPQGIDLAEGATLSPIPVDEAVSSLSAILLNEQYYDFLLAGMQRIDAITYIGADRLIPLKAHAWLNLTERQGKGEQIDSKNIRKHRNDVLSLSVLLAPHSTHLPDPIAEDLQQFLLQLAEQAVDPAAIGLTESLQQLILRIRQAFHLA
ncbi:MULTISPECIES: hypothetical protein [unclassified Pseudomonas]|uniref:hypothetical protein n=1 Tax=unclassified Pseudomonas TaxID=196821 RepID=UPI0021151AEF|nr:MULTISPECIES: hypothetical protein [unclassified Pseudomonas]